jgi:hypothetical protein
MSTVDERSQQLRHGVDINGKLVDVWLAAEAKEM